MNPEQFTQLLITIITSLGGIGVILGAIFAWLGKIWISRIELKTSTQYQKDIDRLRETAAERRDSPILYLRQSQIKTQNHLYLRQSQIKTQNHLRKF